MSTQEPPPNAPRLVEPGEPFRALTEAEVQAALDDPDPANPIACEVARLVEGYTANFAALAERLGRLPPSMLRLAPRWPIEAVAMRLMTETISRAVAEHAH